MKIIKKTLKRRIKITKLKMMQRIWNIIGKTFSFAKLLFHGILRTNRYILTGNMKRYLKNGNNRIPEKDRIGILKFLSCNLISHISYPFIKEYRYRLIKPVFDRTCSMYYVLHDNKKLYFRKSWSKSKIRNMYNTLCTEQDKRSPHSYEYMNRQISTRDIAIDAGAAEGIWSLDIVENVKFIYIFELEEDWIEALNATFSPWKEKVQIINARISDKTGDGMSLDDYFQRKNISPTIIKADIEGGEQDLLKGSQKLLSNTIRGIVICTYHNSGDYALISSSLKDMGFKITTSNGYMLSIHDKPNFECGDISEIIRKGLIFGTK